MNSSEPSTRASSEAAAGSNSYRTRRTDGVCIGVVPTISSNFSRCGASHASQPDTDLTLRHMLGALTTTVRICASLLDNQPPVEGGRAAISRRIVRHRDHPCEWLTAVRMFAHHERCRCLIMKWADRQLFAFNPRRCVKRKSALDPLGRKFVIVMASGAKASPAIRQSGFRATRSISADLPECPVPSSISAS